jgi:hypothetical protein
MRDTRHRVPLSDTSPKTRDVYFRLLSKMTPAERVRIGASLWTAAYALQSAEVRRTNPDADETEIAFRIAVARLGPELARAAWRRG